MVGTPVRQLVDLELASVYEASWSAPPSPNASSPTVEGQQAPSPLGSVPKRAHHAPTSSTSGVPREEEAPSRRCPFPWAPLKPLLAPQEILCFQQHSRGVLLFSTTSLSSDFLLDPANESNLKSSSKLYLCEQCESKLLTWTLSYLTAFKSILWSIYLVCPQCGMSYSDPSRYCHYGKGIHNLLFY